MNIFIQKKEKEIVDHIKLHVDLVSETVESFIDALYLYLDGEKIKSQAHTKQTHKLESQADDYRRKVNREMFEGAFMPSIREALYVAVDAVDNVANEAETTGDILTLVEPKIPTEIKQDIRKMGELTVECMGKLREGVYNLFENIKIVFDLMKEVDRLEEEVDKYVWKILIKIFKELRIRKFSERLMLREFVLHINNITNRMEDASDKIEIIALKLVV